MFQTIISIATFILALSACLKVKLMYRRACLRNEELERQIIEAESLLSRRGKLANEIAHEIKNPITAILCSAETLDLLIGEKIGEDHRRSLHYIKEYGDNLLRLVSNFIDVSRAEIGNVVANPRPVAVKSLVESVMGLLVPSAERKDVTLKCICNEENLRAMVDSIHLKQIIFNLLHNAIKFTSRNGEVHVEIKNDFPTPFVKIAVKDNGRGIPSSQLATLFDPYTRNDEYLSGAHAAVAPGVGLGLALCKHLVEAAGGKISVESQLNIGTCFRITLPLVVEKTAVIQDSQSRDEDPYATVGYEKPLIGQNFLLVNHSSDAVQPVKQLIEAWGGAVDLVLAATEAIKRVHTKPYDAIMIDEEMEDMQWSDLARMLRDGIACHDTTIILAGNTPYDWSTAEGRPIDRVLNKPFNGKVLLDSLLKSGKIQLAH